jgi:hypothetical protein
MVTPITATGGMFSDHFGIGGSYACERQGLS